VPRTSRVSYFQNVFDLLDYEPPVSPAALAAVEETEARLGRALPAALRDWYTRDGVVEVGPPVGRWNVPRSEPCFPLPGPARHAPATWTQQLWYNYVGAYECHYSAPDSLTAVLAQIDGRVPVGAARAGFARVLVESYDRTQWWVERAGSDDPPVWCDAGSPDPAGWSLTADRFSRFVFETIASGYQEDSTPVACQPPDPDDWAGGAESPDPPPAPPKWYANGLWLRAPDEPFSPPVIDFLTDRLGEPQRVERPGGVTTYTFRAGGGTVRVTADAPGLAGGLSAWWVHAQTADRLEALARLLLPWGTLGERLSSEAQAGEAVLGRAKGTRA
jgi:hypothetical protein